MVTDRNWVTVGWSFTCVHAVKVGDFADGKLSFERVSDVSKELIVNTCTGIREPSLWLNALMLFFLYCLQLYTLQTDTPSLSYQEQLSQVALFFTSTGTSLHFKSEPVSARGCFVPHSALNTKCTFCIRGLLSWFEGESQVVVIYISWGYYEALGFPRQSVRRVARKHT